MAHGPVERSETSESPVRNPGGTAHVQTPGLLLPLPLGLLAKVAPAVFTRIHIYAKRGGISHEDAFAAIYDRSIYALGAVASLAWELPEMFGTVYNGIEAPWQHEGEYTLLCCLSYAAHLVRSAGLSMAGWAVSSEPLPEAISEVGIEPEEGRTLIAVVEKHLQAQGLALPPSGAELLFDVVSDRYERGSIVLTTNLPFEEWISVLASEPLTHAMLDRLTHHVHPGVPGNGRSYRLAQSLAKRKT